MFTFFKKKQPIKIIKNTDILYRLQRIYYNDNIFNTLNKSENKLIMLNVYSDTLNNLYSNMYNNITLNSMLAVELSMYFRSMSVDNIKYIINKIIEYISTNDLTINNKHDLNELVTSLEYFLV